MEEVFFVCDINRRLCHIRFPEALLIIYSRETLKEPYMYTHNTLPDMSRHAWPPANNVSKEPAHREAGSGVLVFLDIPGRWMLQRYSSKNCCVVQDEDCTNNDTSIL